MDQSPQRRNDDGEDGQAEKEKGFVALEIDGREAEIRGQALDVEQPILAAGQPCHLMATNQNTWPKAMVSSA